MKRGFTLVEIIVVLGIFGILMIVATDFFVSTIQSSNRASIQTEVRQNAQRIIQDMVQEIRQASKVEIMPGGDLITSSASGKITYHVTADWKLLKNGAQINSDAVAILDCSGVGCTITCPTPKSGLTLTSNSNGSLSIGLVVQQKLGATRSDFCAVTTLNDTATPRLY